MKPKEFYVDIDVWEDGCWFVWPVNKEQAEEWFKDKFPKDESQEFEELADGHTDALSYCGTPKVIFFKDWEMSSSKIGVLAHEIVHVANQTLSDRGVKEKKGCDEALCYLVGFLMRNALEQFKRIEAECLGDEQAVGE
jgi:hypothetical protein